MKSKKELKYCRACGSVLQSQEITTGYNQHSGKPVKKRRLCCPRIEALRESMGESAKMCSDISDVYHLQMKTILLELVATEHTDMVI